MFPNKFKHMPLLFRARDWRALIGVGLFLKKSSPCRGVTTVTDRFRTLTSDSFTRNDSRRYNLIHKSLNITSTTCNITEHTKPKVWQILNHNQVSFSWKSQLERCWLFTPDNCNWDKRSKEHKQLYNVENNERSTFFHSVNEARL